MVTYHFSASGAYESTLEPAEKLFNSGRCPGKLEAKSLLLHHKQLSTFILRRHTYFCACQRLRKSSPDSNCLGTRMHNSAVTLILIFSQRTFCWVHYMSDTLKWNIWPNTWNLTPKDRFLAESLMLLTLFLVPHCCFLFLFDHLRWRTK